MPRILQVYFKGTVSGRADASGLLSRVGDVVVVARGRPRLLVMTCPCGCSEQISVNLDRRAGLAWRLYTTNAHGMSVFPSIWRTSGCESHFVIWNDRIWLLGPADESLESQPIPDGYPSSAEIVLNLLSRTLLTHFSVMAEQLDVVPWDVLVICRELVRDGKAVEGKGGQRGRFRRL